MNVLEFNSMFLAKLGDSYRVHHLHEIDASSIFRELSSIAEELAEEYGSHLTGYIKRWWFELGSERLVMPMSANVKTHKYPVGLRILHNGGRSPLGGIANVVAREIHKLVVQFPHLAFDTSQAISILSSGHIEPGDCMVTLDIVDFFMAAAHDKLLGVVRNNASTARLYRAVQFVLANQYVKNPVDGTILRVIKGSGMGSQISSDLSDLAFHDLVEVNVLPRMGTFGIKSWCRYRDDIIMICKSSQVAHGFLELVKRHAHGVWTIKVEGASRQKLPFLDVLFKLHDGLLLWEPWSKPSRVFLPLHSESAHHPWCHNWPLAECRRLAVNSHTEPDYKLAMCRFIKQCVAAQLSGCMIAKLLGVMDAWPLFHIPSEPRTVAQGKTIVFVLDYHPILMDFELLSTVQEVFSLFALEVHHCIGEVTPIVAFRASHRRLASVLKNL
jgi:hypothetical protein